MTNLTSKKKEKIFLPNLIEKRKRNKKKHFYISGTYEKLAVLSGHNNHRYENQPDQSINWTKNWSSSSSLWITNISIIQNCCCCFIFSDFDVQIFFTSWFIHNTDDDGDDVFSLFFLDDDGLLLISFDFCQQKKKKKYQTTTTTTKLVQNRQTRSEKRNFFCFVYFQKKRVIFKSDFHFNF